MAEAEAVAAAADAAEAAEADAQAAAVAAEAERAEAAAQASAQAYALQRSGSAPAAAATTPVLASAAARAGPYAEAAQSLRISNNTAELQPALRAGYQAGVPRDLQGQQQPQLQRTGSALEIVAARSYKCWAVAGVLMLGFIIVLIIWSTV